LAFTAEDVPALDPPEGWSGMVATSVFRLHPNLPLCAASVRRIDANGRGVGVWDIQTGHLRQFWMGASDLLWLPGGKQAVVKEWAPRGNLLRRLDIDSWQPLAESTLSLGFGGCAIEEMRASDSGGWLTTMRTSGQGEWGYDVVCVDTMAREGGVESERGYMLEPAVFSADESRLVGGFGEGWLGDWWSHPDDDRDEPAHGDVVTFGWIFVHLLPDHHVTRHELKMDIPSGWLPDDPWDEKWSGPTGIAPLGDGVRMTLPGGEVFEFAAALPPVLELPTPKVR
jgi:hypothetical protein